MRLFATRLIFFLSLVSLVSCASPPADEPDAEALTAAFAEYKTLRDSGRYAEAAPHAREALSIGEGLFQDDERQLAHLLGNLAELEDWLGNAEKAETLYRRTLGILEQQPEAEPLLMAVALSNLAELERTRSRPAAAEPLAGRALDIWRAQVGASDPRLGTALANHAAILLDLDRHAEAKPLLQQALTIRETALGRDAPSTVELRQSLAAITGGPARSSGTARARLQQRAGNHVEAERLYRQALAELESSYGADNPNLSPTLRALALQLMGRGAYGEAEVLFKRAMAIHVKSPDVRPLAFAALRRSYATLLSRTGRRIEAERLLAQ